VPLTRGGSDSFDNIQPLCGSCNRKKFVNIIDYRLNTGILSSAFEPVSTSAKYNKLRC